MGYNQLCYGDNLEILRKYIKDESVDLCYIDPPFNSKRNYNQIYNNIGNENKAQAQAFVDTWTWDRNAELGLIEILANEKGLLSRQTVKLIAGLQEVLGKGTLLAYIISMTLRIAEIHRVLKPTGSFYLHCDQTASHYLKLVLDGIFCGNGGYIQSEIVWRRTTAHGNAKQGSKKFEINFDVIFSYTKSDDFTFNTIYEPFSDKQIKQQYNKIDEQGRQYRLVTPTAAKGGGDTSYEFNGVKPPKGRFWAYSKVKMQEMQDNGLLYFSASGQPYIKYYLEERLGVAVMSFWDDVKPMSPTSKERLGYPTQKPEALLERIIRASSNEDDVVLDCYCGCGTTIAVAERLNRKWIGCDITYQSISLIIKRLEDTYGKTCLENVVLNGVPKDMAGARALANKKDDRLRKEFEKWALLTYSNNRAIINEKKGADKCIDGIAFMLESTEKTREVILSVKSGKIGVAQVRDLRGVIERENAVIGVLICLEEPTSEMLKECKMAGVYENPFFGTFNVLECVTIQEILNGKILKLPSLAVLKSAQYKGKNTDTNLFEELE